MARKDSLKKLKTVLLQRREALIKTLSGDNGLLNDLSKQASGDVIDYALDTASDEIFSKLAEAEGRELANIQYALDKMDEGSYGRCEACKSNIPLARLEALPFATLCIKCKRQVEEGIIAPNAQGDWAPVTDSPEDNSRLGDLDVNFS